jgi:hypothetical protein
VSANKKKALAILVCVPFSALVAVGCGHVAAELGASTLASVSAGGGAFGLICGLVLLAIGLFDFTDSPPAPPTTPQQGAPTP